MLTTIKGISLWQPWASAIVAGAKRIETRHWPTNYRGPLAIHAAKRCVKDELIHSKRLPAWEVDPHSLYAWSEAQMGDFSIGRFGWVLDNVRALPKPFPFKGAQGLFNVQLDLDF